MSRKRIVRTSTPPSEQVKQEAMERVLRRAFVALGMYTSHRDLCDDIKAVLAIGKEPEAAGAATKEKRNGHMGLGEEKDFLH